MEHKQLLNKSIVLLYRESLLKDKAEGSADLVRTVLGVVKLSDYNSLSTDKELIQGLRALTLEMCLNPIDHIYDKDDLLREIRIACRDDDKLYAVIQQGIEADISESSIKRSVLQYRSALTGHFRDQQIGDIVAKAAFDFKFKREEIKDTSQFITDLIGKLEPLQMAVARKDPALLGSVDLGDDSSTVEAFKRVKSNSTENRVYKFGWQALNRMCQGGIRPGETMVTSALQHNYKTGFNLSTFAQIAQYNEPLTVPKGKKPLLLRISFEDDLSQNLQFVYQYLKYDELREFVKIEEGLSVEEIAGYVRSKLQATGFQIKMRRIDPTKWTYQNIINEVIQLEAEGYHVEVLALDYLMLVPTIGCITTGPAGTDMRDLLRRIRNFCAYKGIALMTPHQMSSDAKMLSRGGMPPEQFVKEVVDKGYYAGSKQLDQEIDLEIHMHIVRQDKHAFLTAQRGKHRLPTIIADEDDKFFILPFPKGMPIPSDINGGDSSFRRLRDAVTKQQDKVFSF